MSKSVCLTAGIFVALSSFEVALVNTAVIAQEYPGCFMLSRSGSLVTLNSICLEKIEISQPKLVFSDLQSQLILDGTMAQVRGTVTNSSNQVVPISVIYFQLVTDTRIISSANVPVQTGDGLKPGESLSFDKVMSKSDLGDVPPSGIKVQVIKYQ